MGPPIAIAFLLLVLFQTTAFADLNGLALITEADQSRFQVGTVSFNVKVDDFNGDKKFARVNIVY